MAPPAGAAKSDHMQAMVSGFLKLMVSQVATRMVTFTMNLMVARQLSPEAYGLASVQYHLLTTTILQLSREGFRRGCLRVTDTPADAGGGGGGGGGGGAKRTGSAASAMADRIVAVAWLSLPIGAAVAAAACAFALRSHDARADAAYARGVLLHGVAALVELTTEPLAIVASARMDFGLRVGVDTAAAVSKCTATLALVSHAGVAPALAFGWAQLLASCVVAAGYALYGAALMWQGALTFRHRSWDAADRATLHVTGVFSFQAAEKLLLAEGSKLVLVVGGSASPAVQGVYGLVSNLGSLVVRLVFTPFEEVAFTAFSRAGVGAAHDAAARARLGLQLAALCRGVALVGMVAAALGPWYSYTLLRVVYGPRWSETGAPAVLGLFCCYLLLLAVNGVSEAFVHAVLEPSGLQAANRALVGFTAAHLAASAALARVAGAAGLVAADALNAALRIAYALRCMRTYFKDAPTFLLRHLLPSWASVGSCLAASAATAASSRWLLSGAVTMGAREFLEAAALHVGVGAAVGAALAVQLWRAEGETLRQLLRMRGGGDASPAKQE